MKTGLRILIIVIFFFAGVFFLNWLTDPLWYFGGNKILGFSYLHNERHSKINLLNRSTLPPDCYVLGTSVSTVLRPDWFTEDRCFNLALASSTFTEMDHYLRYVESRSALALRTVYTELHWYNLLGFSDKDLTPAYIADQKAPPSPWLVYLNPHTFIHYVGLFFHPRSRDRLYDSDYNAYYTRNDNFEGDNLERALASVAKRPLPGEHCPSKTIEVLTQLRSATRAALIGYVPPISAHLAREFFKRGYGEAFLDCLRAIQPVFDRLVDFSIPSQPTRDAALTYDGVHFRPPVMKLMAAVLEGRSDAFGTEISYANLGSHVKAWHEAIDN